MTEDTVILTINDPGPLLTSRVANAGLIPALLALTVKLSDTSVAYIPTMNTRCFELVVMTVFVN